MSCGQYDYVWDNNTKGEIKEILLGMNVIDVIRNSKFIKQFESEVHPIIDCSPRKENTDKFLSNSEWTKLKTIDRHVKDITLLELIASTNIDECWNHFNETFNVNDRNIKWCNKEKFYDVISNFKSNPIRSLYGYNYIEMWYDASNRETTLSSTSEYALECYSISQCLGMKIKQSTLKSYPNYVILSDFIWEFTWSNWDNE
jgi:hypothetical protein